MSLTLFFLEYAWNSQSQLLLWDPRLLHNLSLRRCDSRLICFLQRSKILSVFDHKGRRYARRVQWVWIPTNCHSFLKFFFSLKCCKWRYKFTSRSLQIRPCTRRMWSCLAFCLVNVALQYQQSKQGFPLAWAVFMCRVKLWADVNTLSQIIHGKRNGLFECYCRTCNIRCLYPKVK